MRHDCHRPSEIVPADYNYLFSYSMPFQGLPMGIFWDKAQDAFFGAKSFGEPFRLSLCNCHVCGSAFTHGDLWKHIPSGQVIAIGHQCAEKYSLCADRADWRRVKASEIEKAEKERLRQESKERREKVLTENPGLVNAFELDNQITRDIKERFERHGYLSDKQIALVLRLHEQAQQREADKESYCAAPTGKTTVTGEIISTKYHDTDFGCTPKMTVKVQNGDKFFLVWSTIPAAIADSTPMLRDLRGSHIQFTATLSTGRDHHFAFAKRPSKASLVSEISC